MLRTGIAPETCEMTAERLSCWPPESRTGLGHRQSQPYRERPSDQRLVQTRAFHSSRLKTRSVFRSARPAKPMPAVVSGLVRAGLLKRHYEGYRVDHDNRGAQRQAFYILAGGARSLVSATQSEPRSTLRQAELALYVVAPKRRNEWITPHLFLFYGNLCAKVA